MCGLLLWIEEPTSEYNVGNTGRILTRHKWCGIVDFDDVYSLVRLMRIGRGTQITLDEGTHN